MYYYRSIVMRLEVAWAFTLSPVVFCPLFLLCRSPSRCAVTGSGVRRVKWGVILFM